jgi:gamma-glutamyltranspeptidase
LGSRGKGGNAVDAAIAALFAPIVVGGLARSGGGLA